MELVEMALGTAGFQGGTDLVGKTYRFIVFRLVHMADVMAARAGIAIAARLVGYQIAGMQSRLGVIQGLDLDQGAEGVFHGEDSCTACVSNNYPGCIHNHSSLKLMIGSTTPDSKV
jgi:hypothetical protein